jgi:hypothetical protein
MSTSGPSPEVEGLPPGAPLVYAHEGTGEEQERQDHESMAHTHDHKSPVGEGR